MKKVFVTFMAGMLAVTLAGSASAELAQGTVEIGGLASINDYNSDSDGLDMTFSNVEGMINYFLSNVWSLGLALDAQDIEVAAFDDITIYGISLRSDYYFYPDAAVIPFIGGRIGIKGYETGGLDEYEFAYGAQGGLKFNVTEKTYVNLEAVYELFEVADDDIERLSLMAGISFTF